MIDNFRWLVDGKIAGSGVPRTDEDIEWLRLRGVDTIVSFSKVSPKLLNKITELGMHHVQIPIEDYGTPEYHQINRFLDVVQNEMKQGRSILMHCYSGIGRTGTMFALFLVHEGLDWQEAVEEGGGLETGSQRLCVQIYQEHRIAQANIH
jgi:atypical dual specificity phosphatase